MMQSQKKQPYGARYWLLDTVPPTISAWVFKTNHLCGSEAYHSYQPTPSGLTLRLIIQGNWIVRMNNTEMQAKPGDLFCALPEYMIEFYTKDCNWEWYELQFTGSAAREFLSSFGCTEKTPVFTPANKNEAIRLFRDIYDYMPSAKRSIWKMQSLTYELLDACNPVISYNKPLKSSREMIIQQVIDLVEAMPAIKMNISELADYLNIDRTTLRRAFQAQLNMNPIDFIKKIRLERAMELLGVSDLPIYSIAQIAGFSDTKYFIRCFREKTGLPPKKWRTINKNNHPSQ